MTGGRDDRYRSPQDDGSLILALKVRMAGIRECCSWGRCGRGASVLSVGWVQNTRLGIGGGEAIRWDDLKEQTWGETLKGSREGTFENDPGTTEVADRDRDGQRRRGRGQKTYLETLWGEKLII